MCVCVFVLYCCTVVVVVVRVCVCVCVYWLVVVVVCLLFLNWRARVRWASVVLLGCFCYAHSIRCDSIQGAVRAVRYSSMSLSVSVSLLINPSLRPSVSPSTLLSRPPQRGGMFGACTLQDPYVPPLHPLHPPSTARGYDAVPARCTTRLYCTHPLPRTTRRQQTRLWR